MMVLRTILLPLNARGLDVQIADVLDRHPDVGLEHLLDSIQQRFLVGFLFDPAHHHLPLVVDAQRQPAADPPHALEYPLTGSHERGARPG